VSDVEALDWLDRLLSADEADRAASLDALAARDPALHARLQRLLATALTPEHSRALAVPVLGVASLLDATRALRPGEVLAGYRLIRELGRGGMSVVWMAERADGTLKRAVAFKMPMFMLQGTGDLERFTRERDALASLSHPNVARLYDAGVMPSGQPFIVLEYVDGQPLTDHCDTRRLDVRARLRLFVQVLAAVGHAHKHLVVHRDLKPSNILVDTEGQVKLLDFGIAKLLGENEGAALTQLMGAALTPLYAAPEQLHDATISTLTDVYSLGVVLFELLTGELPYRGARGRATLVEVLETQARGALPRLGHGLDQDLETIVGKALRIAPDDRYASVTHLADDIQRFLDRKPIAARRPSLAYTLRLALARHRLASAVAAVGLVLLLGASVVAWAQYRESRAHAERSAAVRDFMFNLVDEAEAAEGQVGEVTGRQMVDGAVGRAREDFGGQPLLQGELLAELGRMYVRLGAADSAVPVLEESVSILQRHARPDDAALNKAQAFLAQALVQNQGDDARILALATQARDACVAQNVDCAKARAYAGSILSQIASNTGDKELALAEMRRAAADTEFAFGAQNPETAMTWMSVAIMARNAGQLTGADQAMQRAVRAADGLRLRAADRTELERTMALIDYDLGRYVAARDRLLALATHDLSPGERALQLRILANAYVELGDSAHALQTAAAAVAAAPDGNAAGLAFARQVQARALALAGQDAAALTQIDAVILGLRDAGRSPDGMEVVRARRQRAEILMDLDRDAEALETLRDLATHLTATMASPVERGLTLDLLGVAERRAGHVDAARAANLAARTALLEQLPAQHPYLIRNAALRSGASQQQREST
jgi:tRNA A-37 threonylcarbamoyl transferase component Bud32